jgi:hypothetical protein
MDGAGEGGIKQRPKARGLTPIGVVSYLCGMGWEGEGHDVYCDGCCKGMPYRQRSCELQSATAAWINNRIKQAVTTQIHAWQVSRSASSVPMPSVSWVIKISCFSHDEPGQNSNVPMPSVSWMGNQDFPVFHMASQVSNRVYPCRLSRAWVIRIFLFTHDEPGLQSSVPMPSVSWVIELSCFTDDEPGQHSCVPHAVCLSGNQDFPVLHMAYSDFKPAYIGLPCKLFKNVKCPCDVLSHAIYIRKYFNDVMCRLSYLSTSSWIIAKGKNNKIWLDGDVHKIRLDCS